MHTEQSFLSKCAFFAALLCAGAFLLWSGCDDDDDYDHRPPEGQGSVVIDNRTDNHISVYLDGVAQPRADEGDNTYYNVEPGDYRLILDEDGGSRRDRVIIDVLEGRLTVVQVETDFNDPDDYDIFIYFD